MVNEQLSAAMISPPCRAVPNVLQGNTATQHDRQHQANQKASLMRDGGRHEDYVACAQPLVYETIQAGH
jgi:hypothetical protein